MDRRRFLSLSLRAALASALLPARRASAAGATPPAAKSPRATAAIILWMNGGPSHVDTWDPKPGTPQAGPFKAIDTRTPGMQLCEHLPLLAARSDRLAVLRNLSTREGNHDRARHLVHTGYAPNPTVAHPSLGGWVSEELGAKSDLPPFVSIDGPSETGGFLGVQFNPFVMKSPGQMPKNVELPKGIDRAAFERRKADLDLLDASFAQQTHDPKVAGREAVVARSVAFMTSQRLHAFQLEEEPLALRQAYGDSEFGRGCLLARRLVEQGVRVVEVALDGWDTHQDNFTRTAKLMGQLDPAFSALLDDLGQRNLLQSTLVMCMGEFGRTPKINGNEGRDHHPGAWSAVLAGGGIRGGQVLGQTDAGGEKVVGAVTKLPDLFATFDALLGMDPDKKLVTPTGRPIALADEGRPIAQLIAS